MTTEEYIVERVRTLEGQIEEADKQIADLEERYQGAKELGELLIDVFIGKDITATVWKDDSLGEYIHYCKSGLIRKDKEPDKYKKIQIILDHLGVLKRKEEETECPKN